MVKWRMSSSLPPTSAAIEVEINAKSAERLWRQIDETRDARAGDAGFGYEWSESVTVRVLGIPCRAFCRLGEKRMVTWKEGLPTGSAERFCAIELRPTGRASGLLAPALGKIRPQIGPADLDAIQERDTFGGLLAAAALRAAELWLSDPALPLAAEAAALEMSASEARPGAEPEPERPRGSKRPRL